MRQLDWMALPVDPPGTGASYRRRRSPCRVGDAVAAEGVNLRVLTACRVGRVS
jgi:hypothetical protein